MRSLHPDYLRSGNRIRWRQGTLKALWAELGRRSRRSAPNYSGVVLPGGAHVGMRVGEDGRELTIYRTEALRSPEAEGKWTAELLTFRRAFGIVEWPAEADTRLDGGPMMTFREPPSLFGERE